MTHSQRLAQVRECFCRAVANDLNQDRDAVAIDSESILIRNEFFCGRKISCQTHRGVWFIEEDELKIHRMTGELMVVLSGVEIDDALESEVADHLILKMPVSPDHADRQRDATDQRRDDSDDQPGTEIRRAA